MYSLHKEFQIIFLELLLKCNVALYNKQANVLGVAEFYVLLTYIPV